MKIREDQKVIDVAKDIAEVVTLGDGKTLTASQFLNLFLFAPETQYSFVSKLSGGEKRRLYLLTILMRNPNFLILDEPTNDLDILTLNVLEEYLQNFAGVVIVVSHDRHFMDKVVNGLLVFDGDGEISGFPGSYSDYREWAKENEDNQLKELKEKAQPKVERIKPEVDKSKKLSFKEKRELDTLTKEIEELEKEKVLLETDLGSGSLSHDEISLKSDRYSNVIKIIDQKSERWLELSMIAEG
jgi:ATP-binding cassette subfamily F protein uup